MTLKQAIKHCNKLADITPSVAYGVIKFNKGYRIDKYDKISKHNVECFYHTIAIINEPQKICECCGGLGFKI